LQRKFHSDGIQSVVYRQRDTTPGGELSGSWIAVKTVSFQSIKSVRPHDIVKEADILAHTSHPSVRVLIKGTTVHHVQGDPPDYVVPGILRRPASPTIRAS
jgi:hypothetical protein